jgi:hypothetical protein
MASDRTHYPIGFAQLTNAEITGLKDAIRTAYADHLPEPSFL